MTKSWEDIEDQKVINAWRSERVKLVSNDGKIISVSRRLLCFIIEYILIEGSLKLGEEYDTKFDEKKRDWDPPVLQDWQIAAGKKGARKRFEEEIIDPSYGEWRRGKTLGEVKEFRKEANELAKELEKFFDICPRCKCPEKYCCTHC